MSQSHEALILIQKMVKVPPPKALLLFNTATYQGLHHTPHSISFILNLLLSSDMLLQAQSLILRLISAIFNAYVHSLTFLHHMIHWGHVPRSNTDRDSTAGSKGSTRSKKYKAKTEGNNLSPIWHWHPRNQLIFSFYLFISGGADPRTWWVFNEFKRKVVMDAYSFGIMIKGRCEAGDLMKGFRLLAMLEEFGFSLNVVIYTTLIYGCCKSGDVRLAKKLFCTMDSEYCNARMVDKALNVFAEMREKDTAVRLFNQLKSNGLSPTLVTYNTLIAGYSKVENLAGALDLVKEMEERCIPPSKVTYNSN
ncbi:Pentatricopeptide repeat-containing protein [Glycine soja]|nr:Pentatricopeptide repeat-containing protein [Glycine soja]